MTTQQAIEALHALPRMGQGAPGLARMQNLCDHLGNPEKELQCIHIAGTNGKGSLAAMTSSILTAAGYKTGLTISPYVVDFRERFQIDGEMIPPRTLANLTEKVLDAIDAIEAEGGIVRITITDRGVGIPDIAKAMEPMFTTGDAEERAGLGFAVMQSFMDKVKVSSTPGRGTRVTLTKRLDARA